MLVASFEGAAVRFHTFPNRTFFREKGDCGRRSHARWTLLKGRFVGARWAATGEFQVGAKALFASVGGELLLCKDVVGGSILQ